MGTVLVLHRHCVRHAGAGDGRDARVAHGGGGEGHARRAVPEHLDRRRAACRQAEIENQRFT